MDCLEAEEAFRPVEDFGLQDTIQSSENFQKFIYELFDKNGIINDLRAYLRGHIVNVLKTAETGELPVCQRNFTQRLELPFQALNILIVEYLLTMEFNYTLSVFISEIPLANMVFEFTKNLLNSETEVKVSNLRFEEGDVWSVLNCLGLKCSSEHALKIVEMYRNENRSLLFCILKCVSLYQRDEIHISEQSSVQSAVTLNEKAEDNCKMSQKCKHYSFCNSCQYRVARLKDKYKRKKEKNSKIENTKKINVETFMSNVSVLEQTLIDEMFQELKTVYEAEIEMIKEEQQKKLKHSIANHALQMQSYKEKMEQSFKAREAELSRAIQQKKRFLWGLARSLRDQHEHLTRAMRSVREQSERLTEKESSLKTQLEEAEKIIKKQGEDMRMQISEELVILGDHLETMKRERDNINEERKEMENMKNVDTTHDNYMKENYDCLKNELKILRKYIENMKMDKKCVVERGTITDFGAKLYNNEIGVKQDKLETQLVNDLKKQKNVNFIQSNFEEIYNVSRRPSAISSDGDVIDVEESRNYHIDIRDRDKSRARHHGTRDEQRAQVDAGLDVEVLRQENHTLKNVARQQREYIEALFTEKDRLQRALSAPGRPRTAPLGRNLTGTRVSLSPSAMFASGLIEDDRRVVSDPWRGRHASETITQQTNVKDSLEDNSAIRPEKDVVYQRSASMYTSPPTRTNYQTVTEREKRREKSPKSMLREAKERLRNSAMKQISPQIVSRDKSPEATLREAKMRLRKLEIEAEAVEKSYRDYRRRREENREERERIWDVDRKTALLDVKTNSYGIFERKNYENDSTSHTNGSPDAMKKDFDKYLKEYNTKLDLNQSRFNNKNSVLENVKPIPTCYSDKKEVNYLETPLAEFRKFYQAERSRKNKFIRDDRANKAETSDSELNKSEDHTINRNDNEIQLTEDVTNCMIKNIDETHKSCNIFPKVQCPDKKSESVKSETSDSIKHDSTETSLRANEAKKINNVNSISSELKYLEELKKSLRNDIHVSSETKSTDDVIAPQMDENAPKTFDEINDKDESPNSNTTKIHKERKDKSNLLLVEVENSCKNIILPENQDLLVVIESSIDNRDVPEVEDEPKYPISITVSPKNDCLKGSSIDKSTKSSEFHKDAVMYNSNKEVSSVDIPLELSKEHLESISEVERDLDEYLDDFSADVDNYNHPSENGSNSPISLAKNSDDDKFWES